MTRGNLKDKAHRYADTLLLRSDYKYDHKSLKEGFYDGYMVSISENKSLLPGLIIGFILGFILSVLIIYN
jgi:hypothetical protein